MRFIVREQGYEKPIAAGQFRYEQDGTPTGAVEQWRLTTAVDGYQILRVDLDARDAASGNSFLFHLVRRDDGTPERLGYRYWGQQLIIEGTVLFSDETASSRRNVNGRRTEEEISLNNLAGFWFPSAIGLGIASQLSQEARFDTATLNNQAGDVETLALKNVTLAKSQAGAESDHTIGQTLYQATTTRLSWLEKTRTVFLESTHSWPIKIEREDGLTAVETRYIWY